MATAEAFGANVEALVSWLREITGEDAPPLPTFSSTTRTPSSPSSTMRDTRYRTSNRNSCARFSPTGSYGSSGPSARGPPAVFGRKRRHVGQSHDRVIAGGCLDDDHSTVRMPNQQTGSADHGDDGPHILRVAFDAAQRGHVERILQTLDDMVPTRGLGKGAGHDDRLVLWRGFSPGMKVDQEPKSNTEP